MQPDGENQALKYIKAFNRIIHNEESVEFWKFYAAIQEIERIHPSDPNWNKSQLSENINRYLRAYTPEMIQIDNVDIFITSENLIDMQELRQSLITAFSIQEIPSKVFRMISENLEKLEITRTIMTIGITISTDRIRKWFQAFKVLNTLSATFVTKNIKRNKETRMYWRLGFIQNLVPQNLLGNINLKELLTPLPLDGAEAVDQLRETQINPIVLDVIPIAGTAHTLRNRISHKPVQSSDITEYEDLLQEVTFINLLRSLNLFDLVQG